MDNSFQTINDKNDDIQHTVSTNELPNKEETSSVVHSQTIFNGRPMYEQCQACDTDSHICHGCGEPLIHSGHEGKNGKLHNSEGPLCYE